MTLTDFLPGIAQSHTIKFNELSGLFVGLATNPYTQTKYTIFNNYRQHTVKSANKFKYRNTYEWMIFSPSFSFFAKSSNRNSRHVSPIDRFDVNDIRINRGLNEKNKKNQQFFKQFQMRKVSNVPDRWIISSNYADIQWLMTHAHCFFYENSYFCSNSFTFKLLNFRQQRNSFILLIDLLRQRSVFDCVLRVNVSMLYVSESTEENKNQIWRNGATAQFILFCAFLILL